MFSTGCCAGTYLAIDVCILLIDVCIATHKLQLASSHIDFVEAKLFADSSRDNADFTPEIVDGYRTKLLLFKVRLTLLHGNIRNAKKELKDYTSMAGHVSHTTCANMY